MSEEYGERTERLDECRQCGTVADLNAMGVCGECPPNLVTDGGREQGTVEQDVWLNANGDAEDATPEAAAHVFESLAKTLRESPSGCRYDIQFEIVEVKTVDE